MWAILVAVVATLLLPSVTATVPYSGPGTAGKVPIGDGGASARNNTTSGEDVTHVVVTGIPQDVCRLELAPGLGSHLVWSDNDTAARVWGDAGRTNIPFRFQSHWRLDLYGACTVEVTEDGVVYHDPSGRPFVALAATTGAKKHDVTANTLRRFNITVYNNGTVDDVLNPVIKKAPTDWDVRWRQDVRRTPIAAGGEVVFPLEMQVPHQARGFASVTIEFTAIESRETLRASVMLNVLPPPAPSKEEGDEEAPNGPVGPPPGEYMWETVPAPGPVLVVLLALVIARTTRPFIPRR